MKVPPLIKALQFEAIAPTRAVDEIAAQVRDMVASGQLKPGDWLPSERDLASRLQVSRNTLREALRALEHAGIIEMRMGSSGGAFVMRGNPGVIVSGMADLYHLGAITPEQLTESRVWISEMVVRVVCQRATEDDLLALEANIEATTRAAAANEFDERQRLNREFHLILARITRNPIIQVTMEGVMEVMGQFIGRIGPSESPFTLPSKRRLMKHLRDRDESAAVGEMTTLLERLQTKYLAQWSERRSRGRSQGKPRTIRGARGRPGLPYGLAQPASGSPWGRVRRWKTTGLPPNWRLHIQWASAESR